MSKSLSSPARLFVLLAREAPVGVILRRGPTDWVQLIHWDTKRDIFTPGQWFHGRVYVEKCDLSPDGSLLIYFASKYSRASIREGKSVWTAVSKPPYFTALKIWFQDGTYGGGGLFEDENQVWLGVPGKGKPEVLRPERPSKPIRTIFAESTHVIPYYFRLERDSWAVTERTDTKWALPQKWLKQVGDMRLEQEYVGYFNRYGGTVFRYIIYDSKDQSFVLDAKWADFDQRGRLVLANEGKIFTVEIQAGQVVINELADFNGHQPESVETPGWAQKW